MCLSTAFWFRRCTKLLLQTLPPLPPPCFFFPPTVLFPCSQQLFGQKGECFWLHVCRRIVERLMTFKCFPSVKNFQPIVRNGFLVFHLILFASVTLCMYAEMLSSLLEMPKTISLNMSMLNCFGNRLFAIFSFFLADN